jgi:hypothetical protein
MEPLTGWWMADEHLLIKKTNTTSSVYDCTVEDVE